MEPKIPTFDRLMNPLLRALGALGGSGSVEEIYNKVVELERFSDEVLAQLHDPESSNNTEVWYRLAWARLSGIPDADLGSVRAAFHYVRSNETVEPTGLLDADGLRALVLGE